LEVFSMKKMLKQNKGFSLVELLVAILIMAVIAATAITLFGGVLNQSRESADKETAENIKRAVLTYMSMTNDTDLSCIGVESGTTSSDSLIQALSCIVEISDAEVKFTAPENAPTDFSAPNPVSTGIDTSDIKGEFGPFLDVSKKMQPNTPGMSGWEIKIDEKAQVVTVEAVNSSPNVTIHEAAAAGP
jgi:type IV pilus assembly protein PilA